MNIKRRILLALYYGLIRHIPTTYGGVLRRAICSNLFKKCGKDVTIERNAFFGSGRNIEIGDFSGIGINACIPADTIIGSYVMMGPNCYIFSHNHETKDTTIPMALQGITAQKRTISRMTFGLVEM